MYAQDKIGAFIPRFFTITQLKFFCLHILTKDLYY